MTNMNLQQTSTGFPLHTIDTAPDRSRPLMEGVQRNWGMVPNLIGVFAESPAALEGALGLIGAFESGSFSPTEKQIVHLATSVVNDCHYCLAAHSTMALAIPGFEPILDRLRAGEPLGDAKLEALRRLTSEIVQERGRPSPEAIEQFFAAGYTKAQLLEVVAGIAYKTLTNYVHSVTDAPIDGPFQKNAW